jgi:hypothetical protein
MSYRSKTYIYYLSQVLMLIAVIATGLPARADESPVGTMPGSVISKMPIGSPRKPTLVVFTGAPPRPSDFH